MECAQKLFRYSEVSSLIYRDAEEDGALTRGSFIFTSDTWLIAGDGGAIINI